MGCCSCGHKSRTKTFISFTIIFCLAHIAAHIFTLNIAKDIHSLLEENYRVLYIYLKLNSYYFGLSVTSTVFNFLWIIGSINVLVRLGKTEINQSLITSYILWDIVAIASFIIDVVSIILYAINYSDANLLTGFVWMLIISAHFVFGFIFNIFAIIGMIIITNLFRKSLEKQPKKRLVPLKPPKPVLKKPTREAYLEENNIDRVRDWHNHYENQSDYQPKLMNAPNYIPRLSEIPNGNEAIWNSSSHNNDSSPNHALPGSNTNVFVNGVPSGTLRRQLPWSYMPNPNELPHMQPRKHPVPVSTPYVPAPDYYQKNPKPTSRRDFQEPGWSQHL